MRICNPSEAVTRASRIAFSCRVGQWISSFAASEQAQVGFVEGYASRDEWIGVKRNGVLI